MKLLIFTQKVDCNDPVLGFFCGWIKKLAEISESVHVVCLEEGKYDLPQNVTVYSLGKEKGANKLEYVVHFWQHLYVISGKYDKVFVHMNQEYLLLGGIYWKCMGTPVYFWRNHRQGNIFTSLAVALSTKVFCTSPESFTAKFKKSLLMPAGIDGKIFKAIPETTRNKNSICMVGRISPVKRIERALEAVKILIDTGYQVSLGVVGSVLEKDASYFESLKNYVSNNDLSSYIKFIDAVPQTKLPEIYGSYEICLNLTEDGSFDKTIVEAASCGTIPLVSNRSLADFLPALCQTDIEPTEIAASIEKLLDTPVRLETKQELEKFAKSQSLDNLMVRLNQEMGDKSNV